MLSQDEVGHHLFGRSLRLKVLLWVAARSDEAAYFYQQEAARGVDYDQVQVTKELGHLVALRMVREVSRDGRVLRRQYYERLESPLWGVVEALHRASGAGVFRVGAPDPLAADPPSSA